ncbi:MAG: preprotein translocase subunit SecY [Fimbriimonadaceae bacterium]|nr:preprotein translocase subunit SecY [Fimbriimonadaceae bacterium]
MTPSALGISSASGRKSDKGLTLSLSDTFRLAWEDPDLRSRILFVLMMFAVYTLGVHVPVPVPGVDSEAVRKALEGNTYFQLLNVLGGGALRRLSIFALGLQPYITASIILQVLQQAIPEWKKEMQEGGDYARKKNNLRTRYLSLALCGFQGWGLIQILGSSIKGLTPFDYTTILIFWTAGSMFQLWLGEQISERGIGNGVSLMIFVGIILSLPYTGEQLMRGIRDGSVRWWSVVLVLAIFLVATWFIVFFTTAQRRIPIAHNRRQVGMRTVGGNTNYLPLSLNMAGVLPIIFAISLVYLPSQFSGILGGPTTGAGAWLENLGSFLNPGNPEPVFRSFPYISKGFVGSIIYTALIFFFTYFWTAIQYNVDDIAKNMQRGGSYIPGIRPGKQTKDFLDGVISRITIVGAAFISVVALLQYVAPAVAQISANFVSVIGGTSLLILVSVALETMRQIEANLLMKQYNG